MRVSCPRLNTEIPSILLSFERTKDRQKEGKWNGERSGGNQNTKTDLHKKNRKLKMKKNGKRGFISICQLRRQHKKCIRI